MNNIIEYLLNNMRGAHLVSGGREINCNCPICGESETVRRSTRKGGHFYISVPQNDEPMFYNCKRAVCHAWQRHSGFYLPYCSRVLPLCYGVEPASMPLKVGQKRHKIP